MTEIFLLMTFIVLLFLTMMRFSQIAVFDTLLIMLVGFLSLQTYFINLDNSATMIEWFALFFTIITLMLTRDHVRRSAQFLQPWSMMIAASLMGVCMIAKADHFLSVYIGFELMSLPLVFMMCIDRTNFHGHIAGWRYFILTTCGSTLWLLGMVLLYGLTGEMSLSAAAQVIKVGGFPLIANEYVFGWVVLIMTCLLAGFTVKLGLVPMQRWVYDVYRYVPLTSLAWLSTVPKLAIWLLLLKTFSLFYPYADVVFWLCLPVAIGSIVYGSLMAISQPTIRGLLAYSSIAQMGFVMIGCALASAQAWVAATFFLIVYITISLVMFSFMINVTRGDREIVFWQDLHGLYSAVPNAAWIVFVVMFTLAGVPPFVGFITKFAVIMALIKQGFWFIAVGIMAISVVAAFYYIRMIRVVYFGLNHDKQPLSGNVFIFKGGLNKAVTACMLCVIILLSIYPAFLLNIFERWW